jgi:hypothetical protein
MQKKLSMDPMSKALKEYEEELMGNMKFDAWYQRPEVWSKDKKQKLIDSLLNGYDIGVIYIRSIEDENYDYEVLDGQQRLRTIEQFINGEFKTDPSLSPHIGKIGFEELKDNTDVYVQWAAKKINFQKITRGDREAVAEFFLRLQEGMELNTAEILNAVVGRMREQVIEMSNHGFFDKLGISDKRFRHRLLAAQAFNIELNGDFKRKSFPGMGRDQLRNMYETHSNKVPRNAKSKVKRTLNFLDKTFQDASYITTQGDFLPIYMLVRYLKTNYAINGKEETIEDFVEDFLTNVESVDVKTAVDVPPEKRPYYNYRDARMSGALSSESFQKRFSVILGKYLETYPDIDQKDEQRAFDYGQKLAIYQRDNRECQQCGKEVNFEEAEFHHRERYEDGGPTTVDNGELVHPKCHPR